MVILTTPNNPTGSVYSEEELRALGEVALSEDILILADEIYEHLVYGDTKHVSIASLSPELYDLTITINGFSKGYAMTGWRLAIPQPRLPLQGHPDDSGPHHFQRLHVRPVWRH